MENNNKALEAAPTNEAKETEKKKPGFYLPRPNDWPRLDMKYIKSQCGMLNDIEFKLVILTCKTREDAVQTVKILRNTLIATSSYTGCLTDEQIKNTDNTYLIIRKLIIRLNEAYMPHDNPQHINEHCCCHDHDDCQLPPEEVKQEEPSDEPAEEDIKSEEEIEQEAEDYKEYEKAYDENAQNNARPSVKKSERYK